MKAINNKEDDNNPSPDATPTETVMPLTSIGEQLTSPTDNTAPADAHADAHDDNNDIEFHDNPTTAETITKSNRDANETEVMAPVALSNKHGSDITNEHHSDTIEQQHQQLDNEKNERNTIRRGLFTKYEKFQREYWVRSVCYSPDGKTIAVGSEDGRAAIYDLSTGDEIMSFCPERDYVVTSVCYSPDGKTIAVGGWYEYKSVVIYDISTGDELKSFRRDGRVTSVCYSPDGKTIAVGGEDDCATLYDLSTGDELKSFQRDGSVYSVCYSPDGKTIAVGGYDKCIAIYDISTGDEVKSFQRDGTVNSVCYSPDGKTIAVGGWDNCVAIYDLSTGDEIKSFQRDGTVDSVCYSPDGKTIAVGGWDKRATIYDLSTGDEIKSFQTYDYVKSVCYSPDGKTIAIGVYHVCAIYDISTGHELKSFQRDGLVRSVCYSPDGKTMALGGGDKSVAIYDLSTGDEIKSFQRDDVVSSVCYSPDGKTIAIGDGGLGDNQCVAIYDLSTGDEIKSFQRDRAVYSVCYSPDGKTIAFDGSYRRVAVYDLSTGDEIRSFQRDEWVNAVCYSPDGKTIAVGGDAKCATIYDLSTGDELKSFQRDGEVTSVCYSPDGKTIAVGGKDKCVAIYDISTGDEIKSFQRDSKVNTVCYSPDGKTIAVNDDHKRIIIYNVDTSAVVFSFLSHSPVHNLSFLTNHNKGSGFQDVLAFALGNSAYIVPIHRYGTNACSWIHDLFDRDNIDSADIIDFVKSTSGYAAFRRDRHGFGSTLLANIAKHNHHKLLSDIILHIFANDLEKMKLLAHGLFGFHVSGETAGIWKCLQEHHHMAALKVVLESAQFFLPSTNQGYLSAVVDELLCKFAEDGNSEMVVNILKAGAKGCISGCIPHHDTYLMERHTTSQSSLPSLFRSWFLGTTKAQTSTPSNSDKDTRPLSMRKQQSTSSPTDFLDVWNHFSQMDPQKRIHLKTVRVLLPDLASFKVLKALLQNADSNAPFDCKATQLAVDCLWYQWAQKRFFWYQCVPYLVWLIALSTLCEAISSGNGTTDSNGAAESWHIAHHYGHFAYINLALVCVGIVYFLRMEVVQLRVLGLRSYLTNGWNVRQCLALAAAIAFVVVSFIPGVTREAVAYVSALALLLNWLGLLYYFRLFERTAWIVYTLLRITVRLLPFLAVLLIIVLSFTLTFRALFKDEYPADEYHEGSNIFSTITSFEPFYKMIMMSFFVDYDDKMLEETYSVVFAKCLFLVLMYLVPIVALNALIALISDVFEHILEEKKAVLTRVKAECILELFCLMSNGDREKVEADHRWTYVVGPVDAIDDTGDDEADADKEDRVMYRRANKRDMKKLEDRVDKKIEEIKKEVKDMSEKLDGLEKKFDQIFELLKKDK